MSLKKTLSVSLVAGLLISNIGLAYGFEVPTTEAKAVEVREVHNVKVVDGIPEEEAEDLAKGYIKDFFDVDVEADSYEKRIEYRPYYGRNEAYVWQVSYYKYVRNSSSSFDVVIKGDSGELQNIYKYHHTSENQNYVTKYSREELKVVAENLLKKTNPDLVDSLVYEDAINYNYYGYTSGLRPTEYYYSFRRVEDGIKVGGDGVSISINSGNGEVVSYSYNWTNDTLPASDSILSVDEARQLFKDELGLKLSYLPKQGDYYYMKQPQTQEIKIVYNPVMERGYLLDATTGEFINSYGTTTDSLVTIDITDAQRQEFKNIKAEKVQRSKEMNQEEATNVAKKIVGEIYQQEMEVVHTYYSSYNNGGKNRKAWNISFRLDGNDYANGNIAIDALSEEVLNLYYYDYYRMEMAKMGEITEDSAKETIEYSDAYNKAIDVVKSLYPEKLKSVTTEHSYYSDNNNMSMEYYFNFNRIENGIPYSYNNIQVSINAITGMVQNIYYRWDDVSLPKPVGLISEEKILERYTKDMNLQLQYSPIYDYSNPSEVKSEMKLVYTNTGLDSSGIFNIIDAVTGEYLNWNGQTIKEINNRNKEFNKIIEGHEAEKELKIMIDTGILNLDIFALDEAIPKKEIIKMLVIANGYWPYMVDEVGDLGFTDLDKSDDYYQYIQAAVYQGLLTNEDVELGLNKAITREELAQIIVKFVRLDAVAQAKGIFTIPVKDLVDIDPDLLGYVAIAYGMEIIKDEAGSFNPKDLTTMIDAAIGIYRAFSKFGVRYY